MTTTSRDAKRRASILQVSASPSSGIILGKSEVKLRFLSKDRPSGSVKFSTLSLTRMLSGEYVCDISLGCSKLNLS